MRQFKMLMLVMFCLIKSAYGQSVLDKKVEVSYRNATLETVIRDLSTRYGLNFSYSSNMVALDMPVNYEAKNKSLKTVLNQILKNSGTSYRLVGKIIVLKKENDNGARSNAADQLILASNNIVFNDSIEGKKVALLSDSLKLLKTQINKLNNTIDSLLAGIQKPEKDAVDNDSASAGADRNSRLAERLKGELKTLSGKFNMLLDKLQLELNREKEQRKMQKEIQSSDSSKKVLYTVVLNIVPPDFKFPLIGMVNVAKGNYTGVNIGAANLAKGDMKGFQAGMVNVNDGKLRGGGFGFLNLRAGDIQGAEFGYINISGGNVRGARFGFVNANKGNIRGADLGFINLSTGVTEGLKLGFLNLNMDENKALTAGFINISKSVSNHQVGFINITDTVKKGVPIGFLTIARNGYRRFEAGVSDALFLQGGYKIGVRAFYNIFYTGIQFSADRFRFGYGYGVGTLFNLKGRSEMNIDGIAYHVIESGPDYKSNVTNMLCQLKINYNYKITDKTNFYVGPTLNLMVSGIKKSNGTGSDLPLWSVYNETISNTNFKFWPGLNAGLNF